MCRAIRFFTPLRTFLYPRQERLKNRRIVRKDSSSTLAGPDLNAKHIVRYEQKVTGRPGLHNGQVDDFHRSVDHH
jgi:hypothetical protein